MTFHPIPLNFFMRKIYPIFNSLLSQGDRVPQNDAGIYGLALHSRALTMKRKSKDAGQNEICQILTGIQNCIHRSKVCTSNVYRRKGIKKPSISYSRFLFVRKFQLPKKETIQPTYYTLSCIHYWSTIFKKLVVRIS
jgi:hypothetical protein